MDVEFPAGTDSMVVSVPFTTDDIFPEEDKVFEVYLGASPGVYISPIAYVNVTIENDDPPLPGKYWCGMCVHGCAVIYVCRDDPFYFLLFIHIFLSILFILFSSVYSKFPVYLAQFHIYYSLWPFIASLLHLSSLLCTPTHLLWHSTLLPMFFLLTFVVMNISFRETFFSMSEGDGFVNLTLVKTEGAVGDVTVFLFTMAGSAVGKLIYILCVCVQI